MSNNQIPAKDKILINIADQEPSLKSKLLRYGLIGLALIACALIGYLLFSKGNADKTSYVTEEVTHGSLIVTVSATGQLQPTNEVEVGSEISGLIEGVYVDENDHVKRGQLLAKIDTAKLSDQVEKSKAAVRSAEAQVTEIQATVAETSANLARLRKVFELSNGKVPSKTEMETATAANLRAQANLDSAKAAIAQAKATLRSDETNLSKAIIRSPIDGIVLTRKVEPGQTVAASLQTPVLFNLAENLTQMELQVDVDEADVGQVKEGQPTYFTVDAWPQRRYPAEIVRVSYGSQTKDNVITYKTILKVSNDDLTLRPGMTATAEITTASRDSVLRVSNAALRFTPTLQVQSPKSKGLVGSLLPSPPQQDSQKHNANKKASPQVWILKNNVPEAVDVKSGLSDGNYTEIQQGTILPGMRVITETQTQKK
jgi:HlyD family secretion protein